MFCPAHVFDELNPLLLEHATPYYVLMIMRDQ